MPGESPHASLVGKNAEKVNLEGGIPENQVIAKQESHEQAKWTAAISTGERVPSFGRSTGEKNGGGVRQYTKAVVEKEDNAFRLRQIAERCSREKRK